MKTFLVIVQALGLHTPHKKLSLIAMNIAIYNVGVAQRERRS